MYSTCRSLCASHLPAAFCRFPDKLLVPFFAFAIDFQYNQPFVCLSSILLHIARCFCILYNKRHKNILRKEVLLWYGFFSFLSHFFFSFYLHYAGRTLTKSSFLIPSKNISSKNTSIRKSPLYNPR